jgi:glycosyltransferase involved in cell wall biosynthesis
MTSSRVAREPHSSTVLCVTAAPEAGGAELVLLDTIAAFRDRGWNVSVLNLAPAPGGVARKVSALGVDLRFCRAERFRDPATAARVLRWFLSSAPRFDLAIANDARALLYTALGCTLLRRPYIWHVHDYLRGVGPFERAARVVRPARYVAISHAVRQSLRECGYPDARIQVVHNAVDVDGIQPRAQGNGVRTELADGRAPVVGLIGRILPWKALETLLEAAARLRTALPEALYLVIGDVLTDQAHTVEALRYRESLLVLRDRLGLENRVKFLGHRDDVPRILDALDVVAHTAVDEPFGRVLVEAMAAAKPVVATRGGGVPEIVVDQVTGYLVPPRDPEAFADRLAALADPALRGRFGRAGRDRAVAAFSLPRYREQWIDLAGSVVDRRLA